MSAASQPPRSSVGGLDALRPSALPVEAESRLLRALLRGVLDPTIVIDGSGSIWFASDSVFDVFGYAPAELVGRNIKLLMPEPYRSAHDGYLASYRQTGETAILDRTREFQVLRKDGSPLDVELSVARVDPPAGGQPYFTGSFRDVTERRRTQRAEDSMLRALANLGRSAAVLAHEIKNPITSINLALRAVGDQLGEDQNEILEDLAGRMRLLELKMRQTLAYARLLDLKRTACDVSAVFADVAHSLKPLLDRDDVELSLDVSPDTLTLDADPLRLEEVLTNLISNASEALAPGGRVLISARAAGDRVVLRVEDDGPGVAPSLATTLFDPFVTSKAEGTGLGLSICRRVIEEHGGTIECVPAESLGGACFELRLPACERA